MIKREYKNSTLQKHCKQTKLQSKVFERDKYFECDKSLCLSTNHEMITVYRKLNPLRTANEELK